MPRLNRLTRSTVILLFGALGILINLRALLEYSRFPSDFSQDYSAALAYAHGLSIYGDEGGQLLKSIAGFEGAYNFHTPITVLLFRPVIALPYDTAFILFGLLSITVVIVFGLLLENILDVPKSFRGFLPVAMLFWFPVYANLATGQLSILVAVLILSGWGCIGKGRQCIGGILFGLATWLKLFPVILLIYLVLARQKAAALAMSLTLVFGLGCVLWLVGTRDAVRYVEKILPLNRVVYGSHHLNVSMPSLVRKLFGPKTEWVQPIAQVPTLELGLTLLFIGVVVWCLLSSPHVYKGRGRPSIETFSMYCVVMVLVSPVAWQHYFTVLLLPVGIVYLLAMNLGPLRLRKLALLSLCLLSLPDAWMAGWMVSYYGTTSVPWYAALLLYGPLIGMLVLLRSLRTQGHTLSCRTPGLLETRAG